MPTPTGTTENEREHGQTTAANANMTAESLPKITRARTLRTERGRRAINAHGKEGGEKARPLREDAIDTVTDVLHFCAYRGWDAERVCAMALEHYRVETRGV